MLSGRNDDDYELVGRRRPTAFVDGSVNGIVNVNVNGLVIVIVLVLG